MGRELRLPETLRQQVFVVSFDRATDEYSLTLKGGNSFIIGEYPEAVAYLMRALKGMDEHWIAAIADRANAFVAVQVDPELDMILQVTLPCESVDNDLYFNEYLKKKIDNLANVV